MKKTTIVCLLFSVVFAGCKLGDATKGMLDTEFKSSIKVSPGAVAFTGVDASTTLWNSGDITANITPKVKINPKFDIPFNIKQDFNFNFRKPWPTQEVMVTTNTVIDGKNVPVRVITKTPIIANSPWEKICYLILGMFIGGIAMFVAIWAARLIIVHPTK